MQVNDTEKAMMAGGISGIIAKSLTAPLSRLTILFQVHSALNPLQPSYADSLWGGIVRIYREEGVKGFWKVGIKFLKVVNDSLHLFISTQGNATTVIHRFPYSAINFSFYELSNRGICNGNNEVYTTR